MYPQYLLIPLGCLVLSEHDWEAWWGRLYPHLTVGTLLSRGRTRSSIYTRTNLVCHAVTILKTSWETKKTQPTLTRKCLSMFSEKKVVALLFEPPARMLRCRFASRRGVATSAVTACPFHALASDFWGDYRPITAHDTSSCEWSKLRVYSLRAESGFD